MGGSTNGNFGRTLGSADFLDSVSQALALASLVPGLDTVTNLAAIPVDLARGDYLSAGLDLAGVIPFAGEFADTARLAMLAGTIKRVDKVSDTAKAVNKASDIRNLTKKANDISKGSPLKIPKRAITKVESKNGYSQIKYSWETGKFKYTSRWHTRTPNAPKNQGNSWVVERKIPGIGYGKNARPSRVDILVGKNKWISKEEWKKAISARKNGTATKKQKELLDNGHWKDN